MGTGGCDYESRGGRGERAKCFGEGDAGEALILDLSLSDWIQTRRFAPPDGM